MRQKNPLIQQAKKISMNAPGRGDYRREESLTHTLCRVAGPILVNLLVLCPLREHMSEVVLREGLLRTFPQSSLCFSTSSSNSEHTGRWALRSNAAAGSRRCGRTRAGLTSSAHSLRGSLLPTGVTSGNGPRNSCALAGRSSKCATGTVRRRRSWRVPKTADARHFKRERSRPQLHRKSSGASF